MKESHIINELEFAWIYRDDRDKCYTVFRIKPTHSESDSSYPLNDDGLSIAKARMIYINKRCKGQLT